MADWPLIRHLHRNAGLSRRAFATQLGVAKDVCLYFAASSTPRHTPSARMAPQVLAGGTCHFVADTHQAAADLTADTSNALATSARAAR